MTKIHGRHTDLKSQRDGCEKINEQIQGHQNLSQYI